MNNDFGLTTPTNGAQGGQLGMLQEIEQLRQTLEAAKSVAKEAPPETQNWLTAGVMGALQGATSGRMTDAQGRDLGPAPDTFGTSFLKGMVGGLNTYEENQLQQFEHRQEVAKDTVAQQQELASGFRMLMAQNPKAFENEIGRAHV